MSTGQKGGAIVGLGLILGLAFFLLFTEKIDNGNVGIVYSASGGVKDEVLTPGWHVIGLFDKVNEYPTKSRTVDSKNMVVSTSDGKNIEMDINYTYSISSTDVVAIYKEFGSLPVEELEKGYIKRRLLDATRNVISNYSLIDIYGNKSGKAQAEIKELFSKNILDKGFEISEIGLGAPKPDQATQTAIDSRVKASQELDKKKTDLAIAKAEAEQKKVQATSEAEQKLIKAQAEAKANVEISKSITKELVEYEKAKKWNGSYVEVDGAGSVIVDKK